MLKETTTKKKKKKKTPDSKSVRQNLKNTTSRSKTHLRCNIGKERNKIAPTGAEERRKKKKKKKKKN
jgi:hypothetical protein